MFSAKMLVERLAPSVRNRSSGIFSTDWRTTIWTASGCPDHNRGLDLAESPVNTGRLMGINALDVAAEMNLNSETGFWDWPRTRSRRAIGTLLPGFSAQSFETLEALNLGPSDLVPKLTGRETTIENPISDPPAGCSAQCGLRFRRYERYDPSRLSLQPERCFPAPTKLCDRRRSRILPAHSRR